MKAIVNCLCKGRANTAYFAEIADARLSHPLDATKMSQERPAFFWANTGYSLQRGGMAGFAAPLPMSGNGKSMRLIPCLLDQMQSG